MARKRLAPPVKDDAASETARRIWLAGIGAYGRAFSEGQESLARLSGNAARVFDELVAKGEAIEKQVDDRRRKMTARIAPGAAAAFDERVKKMRERLGLLADPSELRDDLAALEARVAAIEMSLGKSGPRRKSAGPKPSARKKSVKAPAKN